MLPSFEAQEEISPLVYLFYEESHQTDPTRRSTTTFKMRACRNQAVSLISTLKGKGKKVGVFASRGSLLLRRP
jgi:hypothetical protein